MKISSMKEIFSDYQKAIDRITITRDKAAEVPGLEEDVARFDGLLDAMKLKLKTFKEGDERIENAMKRKTDELAGN